MTDDFTKGIAFILEGDTEKEFYLSFLNFLCKKHCCSLQKEINCDTPDIVYWLNNKTDKIMIKFHVVNAITQIPHSAHWFVTQCCEKHKPLSDWTVFLCYDTDDYKNDISKFNEGDWSLLKTTLKKKVYNVVDIAAAADIEDVILTDMEGLSAYLGGIDDLTIPSGRKGKTKIKKIYRSVGKTYHEGARAREMINSLNMQLIMDKSLVPLTEIESAIFCV